MNLGKKGEAIAKTYLENKGYLIREENFRTRYGEIDLIAQDGDEIVFVEVKTRGSTSHGLPCEAVTIKKQMKIKGVANYYLLVTGNLHSNCRMDVIEILILDRNIFLNQLSNAF